jgi:hypothetical protein
VKISTKSGILVVAVLGFGAARLPFEAGLSQELRQARLTPPPMAIDTREHIGQTSSAVALGGLRTLVATFFNLRAFGFFQEQRWGDVAETFDTIVDLAPHTRYYWETGSWHLAYNAASYYVNDSKLPALRRREAWRSSIIQGRAFLERGLRNNPDDWSMFANLGFLLSDPNKFTAFRDINETFAAAAEAYRKSAAAPNALSYAKRSELYALARVPGKEAEALALARSLYRVQINHTPTAMMLLLVLEAHENPALDTAQRAIELFGSTEKAYSALTTHWQRTHDRFPVYGVAAAMESLEKTLQTPADQSIFQKPLPPPNSPDQWFSR